MMYFDIYILFSDKGGWMQSDKKYPAKPERG